MYVELFKGSGRQPYRYRLMSGNGQTLTVSEGYLTRWNAKRAVRRAFVGVPVKADASWGT
jgi:uncharacterized protein YegP (UPF0339 family)